MLVDIDLTAADGAHPTWPARRPQTDDRWPRRRCGDDRARRTPAARLDRPAQGVRATPPSPRRAELHRLADALRGVLHRLGRRATPTSDRDAADDLEAHGRPASSGLHGQSMYEGFAESPLAGGRSLAFFDHSPMLGRANPLAPPIELWLEGDRDARPRPRSAPPTRGRRAASTAATSPRPSTRCWARRSRSAGSPGMTGRAHRPLPQPHAAAHRAALRGARGEGRKIFTRAAARRRRLCRGRGLFISITGSSPTSGRARRARRRRPPQLRRSLTTPLRRGAPRVRPIALHRARRAGPRPSAALRRERPLVVRPRAVRARAPEAVA